MAKGTDHDSIFKVVLIFVLQKRFSLLICIQPFLQRLEDFEGWNLTRQGKLPRGEGVPFLLSQGENTVAKKASFIQNIWDKDQNCSDLDD